MKTSRPVNARPARTGGSFKVAIAALMGAAAALSAKAATAAAKGGTPGPAVIRRSYSGNPPDLWGTHPQCRRMVRNNRMRAMGIGGDKR